jgi:hypothetical protein
MAEETDWASQVAGQIERIVGLVRDRTTRPALTVVRGVVFGVIAAAGGITALVLVSIILIRALTEITNNAWIAYLITAGIFLLAGMLLMAKGASAARKDLKARE